MKPFNTDYLNTIWINENDLFENLNHLDGTVNAIYRDLQFDPAFDEKIAESLDVSDYWVHVPGVSESPDFIGENMTASFGSLINIEAETKRLKNAIAKNLAKDGLELTEAVASKLKKKAGMQFMTVQFQISDGQSITMFFHDPSQIGGVKNKINYKTKLVAYETRLNKQPVTAAITKARGKQLSIAQIAGILAGLAVANKEKWAEKEERRNTAKAEMEEIQTNIKSSQDASNLLNSQLDAFDQREGALQDEADSLQESIEEKKDRLAEIQKEIDVFQADKGADQVKPIDVGADGKGGDANVIIDSEVRVKAETGMNLTKEDIRKAISLSISKLKDEYRFEAKLKVNMKKISGDFSSVKVTIHKSDENLSSLIPLQTDIENAVSTTIKALNLPQKTGTVKVVFSEYLHQYLDQMKTENQGAATASTEDNGKTSPPHTDKNEYEDGIAAALKKALDIATGIYGKEIQDVVKLFSIDELREMDSDISYVTARDKAMPLSITESELLSSASKSISKAISKKLTSEEPEEEPSKAASIASDILSGKYDKDLQTLGDLLEEIGAELEESDPELLNKAIAHYMPLVQQLQASVAA